MGDVKSISSFETFTTQASNACACTPLTGFTIIHLSTTRSGMYSRMDAPESQADPLRMPSAARWAERAAMYPLPFAGLVP